MCAKLKFLHSLRELLFSGTVRVNQLNLHGRETPMPPREDFDDEPTASPAEAAAAALALAAAAAILIPGGLHPVVARLSLSLFSKTESWVLGFLEL